jgi:hypothetical protein
LRGACRCNRAGSERRHAPHRSHCTRRNHLLFQTMPRQSIAPMRSRSLTHARQSMVPIRSLTRSLRARAASVPLFHAHAVSSGWCVTAPPSSPRRSTCLRTRWTSGSMATRSIRSSSLRCVVSHRARRPCRAAR